MKCSDCGRLFGNGVIDVYSPGRCSDCSRQRSSTIQEIAKVTEPHLVSLVRTTEGDFVAIKIKLPIDLEKEPFTVEKRREAIKSALIALLDGKEGK